MPRALLFLLLCVFFRHFIPLMYNLTMTKTFHFMAGLPRSGSTVLSALLNQHSKIYASAQTDLIDLLYQAQSKIPNYESYKAGLYQNSYERVLHAMPEIFYSHIDKPIVIDKNRSWGVPYNFEYLSPILNKNGKVILTLRPIIEILASLIRKSNDNLIS
jgi:sulfotransferase